MFTRFFMFWLGAPTHAAPEPFDAYQWIGPSRFCVDRSQWGSPGGATIYPLLMQTQPPPSGVGPREVRYAVSPAFDADMTNDIHAAALQWSNDADANGRSSGIHGGADVRLVPVGWDEDTMGICQLGKAGAFGGKADLIVMPYVPGTKPTCNLASHVHADVVDGPWEGIAARTTMGYPLLDTANGACGTQGVGVVVNADPALDQDDAPFWLTTGNGLPQTHPDGASAVSFQHTILHELSHALLGVVHPNAAMLQRYDELLAADILANDVGEICPLPEVSVYKRLTLIEPYYPNGGDPGGATTLTNAKDRQSGIGPLAYQCLQSSYGDDPTDTFTNLTLYDWTPGGPNENIKVAWRYLKKDAVRSAFQGQVVTPDTGTLAPIVAARVSDIPGTLPDVRVRWYLTGPTTPCRQGYPLTHPDRANQRDVGELVLDPMNNTTRMLDVFPESFAVCDVPVGHYNLCAVIDPDCEISETREDDNAVYSHFWFGVFEGGACNANGYEGPRLDLAAGENCGVPYATSDNPLYEQEGNDADDCTDPPPDLDPVSCETTAADYQMSDVGSLAGTTEGRPHRYSAGGVGAGIYADASVQFTAPADGTYVFDTTGSSYDAGLYRVSDLDGDTVLTVAASGRDRGLVGAHLALTLTSGEVAYLILDGDPAGALHWPFDPAGDFLLHAQLEQATEGSCFDGRDADNDGLLDCDDGDCWLDPVCEEDCTNGEDDNGDDRIDCVDPVCSLSAECQSICPDVDATTTGTHAVPLAGQIDNHQGSCGYFAYYLPDATIDFTAPEAGTYVFDAANSPFQPAAMYLLDDCGGQELECSTVWLDGFPSASTRWLEAGQSVTVVVEGYTADDVFLVDILLAEESESICDDARDLDADGLVDCSDPDCECDGSCAVCTEDAQCGVLDPATPFCGGCGTCVECRIDTDCGGGTWGCVQGTCVDTYASGQAVLVDVQQGTYAMDPIPAFLHDHISVSVDGVEESGHAYFAADYTTVGSVEGAGTGILLYAIESPLGRAVPASEVGFQRMAQDRAWLTGAASLPSITAHSPGGGSAVEVVGLRDKALVLSDYDCAQGSSAEQCGVQTYEHPELGETECYLPHPVHYTAGVNGRNIAAPAGPNDIVPGNPEWTYLCEEWTGGTAGSGILVLMQCASAVRENHYGFARPHIEVLDRGGAADGRYVSITRRQTRPTECPPLPGSLDAALTDSDTDIWSNVHDGGWHLRDTFEDSARRTSQAFVENDLFVAFHNVEGDPNGTAAGQGSGIWIGTSRWTGSSWTSLGTHGGMIELAGSDSDAAPLITAAEIGTTTYVSVVAEQAAEAGVHRWSCYRHAGTGRCVDPADFGSAVTIVPGAAGEQRLPYLDTSSVTYSEPKPFWGAETTPQGSIPHEFVVFQMDGDHGAHNARIGLAKRCAFDSGWTFEGVLPMPSVAPAYGWGNQVFSRLVTSASPSVWVDDASGEIHVAYLVEACPEVGACSTAEEGVYHVAMYSAQRQGLCSATGN